VWYQKPVIVKYCSLYEVDKRHDEFKGNNLPQSAADESGTSSLTAIFAGGRSVVRALVTLSREPPARSSEPINGHQHKANKKAVLSQGNRAMPQLFFLFKVRRQHSLQV